MKPLLRSNDGSTKSAAAERSSIGSAVSPDFGNWSARFGVGVIATITLPSLTVRESS